MMASPRHGDGQSRPDPGTARHLGPVVATRSSRGSHGEQPAAADRTLP